MPKARASAAVAVAHGAALTDRVVAFGRGEHVRHTAAGPEGRGVIAGRSASGPRTPYPLPRA